MRVLAAVVAAALLTPVPAADQTSIPVYVRPEGAEPAAGIEQELGARDNDPNATSTWATKVFNRSCTATGACTGVSSALTVWNRFPAGYRPKKLVVYWKAASSVVMFGGSSQVRAFVEYATDGQNWTPIDQFVQNGSLLTHAMTRSEADLAPAVDPALLKVRGRLEVELVSCPNTGCPAELPNPSNLSGQIWISDIRLEVEDPKLTATHERAAPGSTVTFRVDGAPGARISNWTFTPASGGRPILRTESHTAAEWSLKVSSEGTVSVRVDLTGQPQLVGRRFDLSKSISVRRR